MMAVVAEVPLSSFARMYRMAAVLSEGAAQSLIGFGLQSSSWRTGTLDFEGAL